MNAFTYQMPAGIPGVANRLGGRMPEIEAQIMDPANPLGAYGIGGQIDSVSGLFRLLTNADTAIYGLLVRPYPIQPQTASGLSGSVALGAGVPPSTQSAIDVMKSGRMTVVLQANNAGVVTNPVKGGTVYVCIQNPPAGGVVGGILGAADGGNTIALPATSYFMGSADGSNNVEVALDI